MRRLAFIVLALILGGLVRAGEIKLDDDTRAWLEAHPKIAFSYDPNWQPFSYRDEAGIFRGLDADVLHVLAARLGVKFQSVPASDWPAAYRSAVAGEALMLTGTARAPEREADFLFTRPYISFPTAIITRTEVPDFDDPSLLIGMRVAGVRDYAPTLALRRDFPEVEIVDCSTIGEALRFVAGGKADAVLCNLVTSAHLTRQQGLTGLKVAGVAPYTFQLRIAVRRDHPVLHKALDAAIASLGHQERQELISPYVRMETGAVVSWRRAIRWLVAGVLLAGAVIGAIAWHNRRLRQELAERRRLQTELEASHDRLARLNEEKSGLMRMAAHDLRNPLSSLMLSLDLLRLEGPAIREGTLDRMSQQANRMMHLLSNLLDVQALESGARRIQPERILIDQALPESLTGFEAAALRKNIRLSYSAPEPGLAVHADRSALRQIAENLVSNAVKYSHPGASVHVSAARAPDPRFTLLCVRDEGPGVHAGEMPLLFQKYTCLSARPTAGESSTGLGLSIVKELVQRLGGRVWCESEHGRGAAFFVELPATAGAPTVSP
jgi:two-component system, NarL family, sensor histidine kinase EvgS